MNQQDQINAIIRKMIARQKALETQNRQILDKYEELVNACEAQPRSITQEIDSIPGRRIFYTLNDRIAFDTNMAGRRGEPPLQFNVSQDGAFIATHYPLVMWMPTEPVNATNFGAWKPVSSFPLPTQEYGGDVIDVSWEVADSGSERNFQNEATGPLFSRPDNIMPLPVPTLFAPNTVISVHVTFERIFFDGTAAEPTTAGELYWGWPGYKIVSM
jgi:hypothetical protein